MNFQSINEIKALLTEHGFSFAKKFGQNFLINADIPKRIASAAFGDKDVSGSPRACLEIGPGIGTLTNELSFLFDKVISVEIDDRLIPVLSETLKGVDNVEIINEDILKVDLKKLFEEKFQGYRVSVAANLPYYITSPIIMALLESGVPFDGLTVMVQKEVALRLASKPGTANYGAMTAACAYYGTVKKLFDVSPGNFIPRPNVTSAVMKIELYDEKPVRAIDDKMYFRVVRGAFAQRRKTLVNSMSSEFPELTKDKLADIITSCGIDVNQRGETLSTAEYARIADAIFLFKK